jgi:hypothetical protein
MWFVFVLYFVFSGIMAYDLATSIKAGIYVFIQLFLLLIILAILTTLSALAMGAREPLIKALRLVGLCLPPICLTLYFLADKSPLVYIGAYPVLLYIYSSAFMGPKNKFGNAGIGAAAIILTGVISYFQATNTDSWFDQKLSFDGYKAQYSARPAFTDNESKICSFLLTKTPELGHIAGVNEISDSLKINRTTICNVLMSLDQKGPLVLGSDYEIRYAYPWSAYDNGYQVVIQKLPDTTTYGPIYAASALDALAAAAIFKESRIWIYSHLKDTGQYLIIEIENGRIKETNYPDVQIYKSDIFSEIEFYSSPSGAKASYRGRFDATHLLDLERAIVVAGEQFSQKAAGLSL